MITKFKEYIKESDNFDTTSTSNIFAKEMIKFYYYKFNFKTNLVASTCNEEYEVALYNGDLTEDDIHPMDNDGYYICKVSYINKKYYFQISDGIDEESIIQYDTNSLESIDFESNKVEFNNINDLQNLINTYLDDYIYDYYDNLDNDIELRLVYVLDTDEYSNYVLNYFQENLKYFQENPHDDIEEQLIQLKNSLQYLNEETINKIEYFFNAKNFNLL